MGWLIGIGVIVLLLVFVISIYNRLVALRQNCNQGFADIDAQLRQRNDLIPNLVNTVKGYAAHESQTLDAVIAARAKTIGATGPAAAAAEAELGGALGRLFALAEAYPDLKANTNFQTLQHELADIEDKLAAARRAMNAAVADYNGAREAFPAVLFASAMGFQPRDFMTLSDAERPAISAVPGVNFSPSDHGTGLRDNFTLYRGDPYPYLRSRWPMGTPNNRKPALSLLPFGGLLSCTIIIARWV